MWQPQCKLMADNLADQPTVTGLTQLTTHWGEMKIERSKIFILLDTGTVVCTCEVFRRKHQREHSEKRGALTATEIAVADNMLSDPAQ